jgi:hypothetical protein
MITVKEIASALDVKQVFKQNWNRRRKRQFDYESTDEGTLSAEQAFRTGYFLFIIDQAITSMNTWFEQLQQYDTLFGFLYNVNTIRQLDDDDLLKCCMDLDLALRSEGSRDLDGADLCAELKIFREIAPESVRTAIQCLQYLWTIRDSFSNTAIAYRISLLKTLKLTFMIVWKTVIYSLVSSSLLHVWNWLIATCVWLMYYFNLKNRCPQTGKNLWIMKKLNSCTKSRKLI